MTHQNRVLRRVFVFLLGLGLTLTVAQSAAAAVIYDFSLAANGEVGPIRVVVRFDDFVADGSFVVLETSAPAVQEFSTTNAIDPASVIGVDVIATATRYGIAALLPDEVDTLLLTREHPDDFFVFDRTPTQTGTFQSTGGLVESSLSLDTRRPTATLTVTEVVPEPATMVLLGLACIGAAAHARRIVRRR